MEYTENAPLPQNGQGLMKEQPKFTILDLFFFPICFVLTYGLFASIQETLEPNIYSTACYLGIFALASILIAVRQKRFAPAALLPGALCVATSLSFALHSDQDLHLALFLLLIPLSGFYCLALTGANVHPFGSFYVLLDLIHCELTLALRHLFVPLTAMMAAVRRRGSAPSGKKRKPFLPIFIGILVAILILLIVIPLLLDADAAFESVAGTAFHFVRTALDRLDDFLTAFFPFSGFALVLALVFTPYIFSVMFGFANGTAKAENRDTSAKYRKLQKAPVAFFAAMLGVVCAVYVIYLLSQFAYFFSAFSGKLPSGAEITVTEYARRGFFEMVKIAAVNFLLIASSVGLCKRRGTRLAPVIRWLNVFLCAFTILLCAISICKILMYIRSYGLTEKRLYVFAADIALIFCFAAILLRLFKETFPYMQMMLAAIFLSAAALGLLGVNKTIARVNTNGLLDGRFANMTAQDIAETGDAALPHLLRLAGTDGKTKEDAEKALDLLYADTIRYRLGEGFENAEQARFARYLRERNEKEPSLTIEIIPQTEEPIYALEYDFVLDGESVFGGGMMNADGSQLKDTVVLTLERRDLPEDFDFGKLEWSLSVALTPENKDGQAAMQTVQSGFESETGLLADAAFGETYAFILCGSSSDGFYLYES